MATAYDTDLERNAANFQPLTPLSFLARAAGVYPDVTAIVHGKRSWNYRQFYARARQLASALARRGIKRGDTVSVMLANTPAMLEAHYGVPMAGAVLNTLNTRLDAAALAFMLDHGEAKVLITDREFSKVIKETLGARQGKAARHRLRRSRNSPAPASGSARSTTKIFSREGDPELLPGRCRATNGMRSRSTTRRARPAIQKASSSIIAALICSRSATFSPATWAASGLSVDAADVSLQRLVLPLDAIGRRRHPCVPALGARRADLRRHRRRTKSHICAARRS